MITHSPLHHQIVSPIVDSSSEVLPAEQSYTLSKMLETQRQNRNKKTRMTTLMQPSQRFSYNCSNCTNSAVRSMTVTYCAAVVVVSLYILSLSSLTMKSTIMVMGFAAVRPLSFIVPTNTISISSHQHHGAYNALRTPNRNQIEQEQKRNSKIWAKQPIRKLESSSPGKKASQSALSQSSAFLIDSQQNVTTGAEASSYTNFVEKEMYYYSCLLSSLEDTFEKSDSSTAGLDVITELSSASIKGVPLSVNSVIIQKEESDLSSMYSEKPEQITSLSTTSSAEAATSATPVPGNFMGLSDYNLARILLIGAAALYGTNFSLVKMLGNMDIPIGISATLRFGLAALATSPFLFMNNNNKAIEQKELCVEQSSTNNGLVLQELPKTGGKLQEFLTSKGLWTYELGAMLVGLEAGVWNSMAYITQAVGLTTTAASKSAFLCSLAVVIVPLLDRLSGKKLEMKQILGVLFALSGVAVLELGGLSSEQLQFTTGDIASLMQPLAFGMAFWRMEHACHNYPDQATRLTASQLLAVFTCSTIFTLISDPSSFQLDSIIHWLSNPMIVTSLAWTGLVSTALTVYMETIALKSVSAAETTLILSTEPLWGSFFAAILMGETFGLDAVGGGVLILLGCLYSSLGYSGIKSFFDSLITQPAK